MALTQEQIDQIEFQKAQQEISMQADSARIARDNKMESVRIARDILMENDRNKPVNDRGVTADDVTQFADKLVQYITK